MGSRSNVGTVRSMQVDRGARIRKFRELSSYSEGSRVVAAQDDQERRRENDINGQRYAAALKRLTTFRTQHRDQRRKDRQKVDWQEEHEHLRRASRDLTKAIQEMLSAVPPTKSCPTVAPAWGGAVSRESAQDGKSWQTNVGGKGDTLRWRVQSPRRCDKYSKAIPCTSTDGGASAGDKSNTREKPKSCEFSELVDLHDEAHRLDVSRRIDLEPDASHVLELRMLIADTVRTFGTVEEQDAMQRAGIIAQLLVQVRTAQITASTYLSKRLHVLETDVEDSKRALARMLTVDCYGDGENCSFQARVLDKIGIGSRDQTRDSNDGGDPLAANSESETNCGDEVQKAVVRADVISRLEVIESKHRSCLARVRDEFLDKAAKTNSAGSAEAALEKAGGWTSDQHFRFMKVLKAAVDALTGAVMVVGINGIGCLGPQDRSALTMRLRAELPDLTADEISRHETWHRQRSLFGAKKRSEKKRYTREVEELVFWGKESLETLRQEEKAAAVRAEEMRERESRRRELETLLREQKNERDEHDRQSRERENEREQQRECREAVEAKQKAAEGNQKRQVVAEYRASLQELRAREAQARAAEERAAEAERAERMPKNRERIVFREERARLKREEQERREREAQAVHAKRLQVLEKLALSVPYAKACAAAEAKLDHVTAATAAHFDQFSQHDRSRGHCPMFGYNTSKVFRDARFRLGLYLREVGVSHIPAAHAAVMRAVGSLPDAPF